MNRLLKEANQMLKFWCLDADNSLEERAKKKLAEGGRIQVIAPNGDRCSVVRAGENMVQSWSEKRHQWESFPLSKCKILSVDAEPKIFQMIKEVEENIKEYKHDIDYMKKHGQDPTNVERWLKEEEARLKAYKEIAKLSPTKDNDATENGAIKQFGQSKQTEVMPVEKKPVLAQDDYKPDPKVIQILEDLRAHKLTPGAADKMLVQAGVPYVMAGLMVRKPEQYIPVNDEEPVLAQDSAKWLFVDLPNYEEAEDYIRKLKFKYKDAKIISKPHNGQGKYEIMVTDEEPVYTLGEESKEDIQKQIDKLKRIEYVDSQSEHYKPNQNNLNKIKKLEEKLKKMTKDEKTYQSGEHIKIKWGSREGDLIDVKVLKDLGDKVTVKAPNGNVVDVPKIYIKDTLDECMEVLRLSGFATDAYDPKKYEGDFRHEWNERELQREVEHLRSTLALNKQRITTLRNMVNSHQYGDATLRELKEEERDYEANQMKMKQTLSMLQRIRGQKDEAPTMDAEPTWQDVYKYFTNASLQELEKLDSKDKVISFLLHKGAYGKFPKDKIDEAIRRFMDS